MGQRCLPTLANGAGGHRVEAEGLALSQRPIIDWLKMKNPNAPAVKREAEEDGGKDKWR
jgi:hypothetical protein